MHVAGCRDIGTQTVKRSARYVERDTSTATRSANARRATRSTGLPAVMPSSWASSAAAAGVDRVLAPGRHQVTALELVVQRGGKGSP